MAKLDSQTSNAITEIITEGEALQATLNRLWSLTARFNLNGIYTKIASAQDLADTGFSWLNQSEIGNVIETFKAVQVALGAGNQATPVRDNMSGKEADLLKVQG